MHERLDIRLAYICNGYLNVKLKFTIVVRSKYYIFY